MNEELKKPSGFLWMDEWAELTAELTNEQIGILLRAAQNFHLGNPYDVSEDKELRMAFRFISNCIKQNDEKYGRACKLKAEARERQLRNRNKKNGIIEDMSANAEISEDMPTNADYQNTSTSTNQSTSTNTKGNKNTTPYKKGVCITPAPAREDEGFDPYETYGCIENVKMSPDQYRHLIEEFGEQAVDEVVDDFSCKLADGNAESNNHYATIRSWLSYRRRNDTGSVPMSSNSTATETEEQKCRRIWSMMKKEDQEQHLKENNGLYPWEDPRYNKSLIQQDYGNAK